MPRSSESPPGGLGLLPILGALGFALVAPIGLLTLPLAGLLLLSRGGGRGYMLTGTLTLGISLWWIARVGEPPDQVVRAAAVMGTTAFVLASIYTSWSLIHRSLCGLAAAALGVSALVTLLHGSWSELRWWVETRIGFAAQLALSRLAPPGTDMPGTDPTALQPETLVQTVVPLMADFFPATLAVQMLAGLVLATAVHRRLTPAPRRGTPERFRNFRFSEHFGWVAVVALGLILLTRLTTLKLLAANVLVVAGVLYALRGAAVAWFGLTMAGGPGLLTTAAVVLSVVFMLPVVLAGTILLGVADTGLDLRQRWISPRARR